MNIFKFYAKSDKESKVPSLQILPGQEIEKYLGRRNVVVKIPRIYRDINFFELIFNPITLLLEDVRPIDWHDIKPEVIHHGHENNLATLQETIEYKKDKEFEVIEKIEVQEVVDRCVIYGESFKEALRELLLQFPIKVEYSMDGVDVQEDASKRILYRKATALA